MLYLYELQLEEAMQRKGLGKFLMLLQQLLVGGWGVGGGGGSQQLPVRLLGCGGPRSCCALLQGVNRFKHAVTGCAEL